MSNHPKMPVSQRAKQFMPFDALPGFRDALKRKEFEMGLTTKKSLSEEAEESINDTLESLKPDDLVRVTYFREEDCFDGGAYVSAEGRVTRIDTVFQSLTIQVDRKNDEGGTVFDEIEIKIDDIEEIEHI